jgi:hypothetical protein
MREFTARGNYLGRRCISIYTNYFDIEGHGGKHICILQAAFGMSLYEWKRTTGAVSTHALRICFRNLLRGLYYLHSEAQIVHTGELPDVCLFFIFTPVL